jgi:hypothetical protein
MMEGESSDEQVVEHGGLIYGRAGSETKAFLD